MNWHYVEQGQQTGPFNDDQFAGLVRTGKIQPDTMVWREGMAGWQPYREITGPAGAPTSSSSANIPPLSAGPIGEEAVCAECGKIFPINETIRYGTVHVCANCKPAFLQKLSEGAQINTGELRYAPILTRFAAVFLDGLILWVVNMGLSVLWGIIVVASARSNPAIFLPLQLVLFALQLAIGASYEGLMVGKYGATLGKMAAKIKVVTADGGRISYGRAFGRYFAKILSSLACLIGYIMACFDAPQRRALHDHICNTRVVYK
ncbi:MAG TPA: RDD family protein [Verrucomicrobiae bacterium]|jgi:uncharacterized RDD family membrane protein YckC